MLIAFSIAPGGAIHDGPGSAGDGPGGGGEDGARADGGVSDVVAEAVRVVRESGLPHETTAMFTTIEAETWEEGMEVVRRAVEAVQARAPRVSLVLKADIRPGYTGQLAAKVQRVEQALRERTDGSDGGGSGGSPAAG